VLVKPVYGHFGDEVHLLLPGNNLAPQVHATSKVEGAPKAYVLEYLGPSARKCLSDYSFDILLESGKVHW